VGTPGLITTSDGYRYALTPTDLLWAARMIKGEGGNQAAVLWTMASRLAMTRGRSFTTLIRGYSQPINPDWARGGTYCGPGGRYASDEDRCGERHLAARERISSLQPDDMPAEWALVQRWSAGLVPNPAPRAVEFATPEVVATCVLGRHGDCASVVLVAGNAYASSSDSDGWPSSYVRVGGAGDASSFSFVEPLLGLGVAAVVGGVTFFVLRGLR
jgi:hypothetical protein